MDIYEIRRNNLRAVRDELGSQKKLAELLGRSEAQLSALIGAGAKGHIGTNLARDCEKLLAEAGLIPEDRSVGWLDLEHAKIVRHEPLPPLVDATAQILRQMSEDEQRRWFEVIAISQKNGK